ncbi:MAG: hypothetical protein OXC68_08605 [Aestuariivita sp.]|nr:hypothetical protein [Aestuariivita sp.]
MAQGTLAAASQMVWRTPTEVEEGRHLFAKVTGQSVLGDQIWRNKVTWGAAVLLALSVEQSLKAVAIKRNGTCLQKHDLTKLWNDLDYKDRGTIAHQLSEVRNRVRGTNLDDAGTAATADEIVYCHQETFLLARYYKERRSKPSGDLARNIDLWQFAMAAYLHACADAELDMKTD